MAESRYTGLVGTESHTPHHLQVSPEDRGYDVDENHMLKHIVTTMERNPLCLLTVELSLQACLSPQFLLTKSVTHTGMHKRLFPDRTDSPELYLAHM